MAGVPKKFNFSKDAVEKATSSSFDIIPNGNYKATVFAIKAGEFGDPKPGSGNNKGKPFWNVQYRISEGQFENRRLFQMVGLFEKWADKSNPEPNSDGADNFTLPQFLSAIGVDLEAEDVSLPDADDVQGTEVVISIGLSKFEYNGQKQNEIKSVKPKGSDVTTAKAAPPKSKKANENMTL